jgi:hypothetical protein
LEEFKENLSHDSQSPDRDLKPVAPECKARELSFNCDVSQHNVRIINITDCSKQLIFNLDPKREICKFLLGESNFYHL